MSLSNTNDIIFEENPTLPTPPFDQLKPLISKTLFTRFEKQYYDLLTKFNKNDNKVDKLFIDEITGVTNESLLAFFTSYSELLRRFGIEFHVDETILQNNNKQVDFSDNAFAKKDDEELQAKEEAEELRPNLQAAEKLQNAVEGTINDTTVVQSTSPIETKVLKKNEYDFLEKKLKDKNVNINIDDYFEKDTFQETQNTKRLLQTGDSELTDTDREIKKIINESYETFRESTEKLNKALKNKNTLPPVNPKGFNFQNNLNRVIQSSD